MTKQQNINDIKFLDDWEQNKFCITMTHFEKNYG